MSAGTYEYHYSGGARVRPLKYESFEISDKAAHAHAKNSLPHYWPTYWRVDVFEPEGKHIARYEAHVEAVLA